MSDIDHTRDCVLPSDGRAEGLVKASELFAMSAERDALRAEVERLSRDYNTARDAHDERVRDNARLRAEVEKLKQAYDAVLKESDAEVDRLRAALLPFASIQSQMEDYVGYPDIVIVRIEASIGELKRARAALSQPAPQKEEKP